MTLVRKCAAEAFGTFALVFAGTGAIAIDEVTGGSVTHVGVAFTFGLVILAMIYAFGDDSGAHFNPAVTLGFFAARRFSGAFVLPFIGSQIVGAVLASVTVRFLFPTSTTFGATTPSGSAMQSFLLEVILTCVLMVVILSVSTGAKERGITAGIAIGAVIAFEALFAGPISGASMNPARSFAPALVSGHLGGVWIYLVAPVLGAFVAIVVCRSIRQDNSNATTTD